MPRYFAQPQPSRRRAVIGVVGLDLLD